jgi:hypothetical protein
MNQKPIRNFYYGIVTDAKGFMQYLGCDDKSGGFPYLSPYAIIHLDTMYLEAHRNDWYVSRLVEGIEYTLTIHEVNPFFNSVREV